MMVTAGIYLLIRVSWIFIAHLGAFVAFFAASMALVNKDLKKGLLHFLHYHNLGICLLQQGLGIIILHCFI